MEISAACLHCLAAHHAERCSNTQFEWHAFDTRCSGDVSPDINRGPGEKLRRTTVRAAFYNVRAPRHARSTPRVRFLRTLNWKRPALWTALPAVLYVECAPHVANTNAAAPWGASGEGQPWMANAVPSINSSVERRAEFPT